MKKGPKTLMGKPKEEWRKDLSEIEQHTDEEISLTKMEKLTGIERAYLSRVISKLAKGRREAMYNTKAVYDALKEKLEEEST